MRRETAEAPDAAKLAETVMSESTDLLSFRADASALDGEAAEAAEGLNAALDRIARIVAEFHDARECGGWREEGGRDEA